MRRVFKLCSLYELMKVYMFTLKVESFSLLLTRCRALFMKVMLVVNDFVSIARDDCMTERRTMKNHR